MKQIAVVGAAGEMISVAVRAIARSDPDIHLRLVDINAESVARLSADLHAGDRVSVQPADLTNPDELRRSVAGADLVINGAGPFFRTFGLVARACLQLGIDYLDIGDDIEAAEQAFELSGKARDAGVRFLVGCGVSPGITNVYARELIERLDEPVGVAVAWLVGDEGDQQLGDAVLAHALHMVSGDSPTWREGHAATVPAFESGELMPFTGLDGGYRAWQPAHPEVVTIPRHYPALREVACYGALHPAPVNGLLRGIARAAERGSLSEPQAIAFLGAVLAGKFGSLAGWRAGLAGIRDQVRRGELSGPQMRRFLWRGLLGKHEPFTGGICAIVTGTTAGKPVRLIRRSGPSGPGTEIASMAQITGHAAAAFIRLSLGKPPVAGGAYAPEGWVEPAGFYQALAHYGVNQSVPGELLELPAR